MTTRVKRVIHLTLLVLLAPAGLATATAQDFPRGSRPVFVTIFDLRQADPEAEVTRGEAAAAVSFPYSEIDQTATKCETLADPKKTDPKKIVARGELLGFLECALNARLFGTGTPDATFEQRLMAADRIAASLAELRKTQSTRVISARGSEIVAVAIQAAQQRSVVRSCEKVVELNVPVSLTGRHPAFKITETKRDTQLKNDFGTLLELAPAIAKPAADAAVAGAPANCAPKEWAFKRTFVSWVTAKPIALSEKRATVELKATLPAVAPEALVSPEKGSLAETLVKTAAEYLKLEETSEQVIAEKEELDLYAACPPSGALRFDPVSHARCALNASGVAEQLAAVEALSKMTAPSRLTVLRWAVENRRGTVRERALVALGQATPGPGSADPKPAEAAEQALKLTSGPLEHWSLSATMFVSRDTTFKKADGQIGVDGTPPIFYLSLNFLLGDVLSDERKFLENVELKWLLEGSKTPLDSMGIGLGLRGKFLSRFGIDFDVISPFVGVTWTKAETAGAPRIKKTRLGVSLDLKKALDWVK